MEAADKVLLEQIQLAFPLNTRPFKELGVALGWGEEACLKKTYALKAEGIIRQIGGVFESQALGYRTALVALKVPPEKLAQAVAAVNPHPGVSHNYLREHPYNLWFTIALPREQNMEQEVQEMGLRAGAAALLFLPTLKVFKIQAFFPLVDGHQAEVQPRHNHHPPRSLTEREQAAVRALQEDLPIHPRPFVSLAQREGLGEEELLTLGRGLLEAGVMRRYSAHLHHRRIGFTANALGCWTVSAERAEEVGRSIATSPYVTHCYLRPSYPHWPYSLYTMLHSSTQQECQALAQRFSQQTGVRDYLLLFSTEEYKKSRVQYFR